MSKISKLKVIFGHLVVKADFKAPALQTIKNDLYVSANFYAPKLKEVGGKIIVKPGVKFYAPMLNKI